jgi:hypothetical protein
MSPGTYKRATVRLHHKALIWFSANPDEYLTVQDIKDKWGGTMETINTGLRYACDAGLLMRTSHPDDTSKNGRRARYEAGPAIRMTLGLSVDDEEQP